MTKKGRDDGRVDKPAIAVYAPFLMAIPTNQQLLIALSKDLNKSPSNPTIQFVDEAARKTFTANQDGILFEFAHKQPDSAYWNGVKYYSSGKQTKIRFPRTQPEPAEAV